MFPRLALNLGLLTSTSLDTGVTSVCHQAQLSSKSFQFVPSEWCEILLSVPWVGLGGMLSLGLKGTVSVL